MGYSLVLKNRRTFGIASNAGSALLESGHWDNMTSGNLGGAKPVNTGDMGNTGPGNTGTPLQ